MVAMASGRSVISKGILVWMVVVMVGCAGQPPATGPARPSDELAMPPALGTSGSRSETVPATSAVAALLQQAAVETGAGDLEGAARTLERTLRIEPRNPLLWSELAMVRLRQGELEQAEQLALKSNLFAAGDQPLRVHNWRLIANVRRQRGDPEAAAEARRRADELLEKP